MQLDWPGSTFASLMTKDLHCFDRELEARDFDLQLLAQRLVAHIHATTSVYEPRRAKGQRREGGGS